MYELVISKRRNTTIKTSEMFTQYVSAFETNSKNDPNYSKLMAGVSKIAIGAFSAQVVERTIRPFLYNWGGMQRILGQDKKWTRKISCAIAANKPVLEQLRSRQLENESLPQIKTKIKVCYSTFKDVVGDVGATKILHSLCPNLFPPWDNPIIKAFISELKKKLNKTRVKMIKDDSAEKYYMFMELSQHLLKQESAIITQLGKKYYKSPLKILDECMWCAANQPFTLLLRNHAFTGTKSNKQPVSNANLTITAFAQNVIKKQFGKRVFTRQELINELKLVRPGINITSVIPSDWCINMKSGRNPNLKFLKKVSWGKYRLCGRTSFKSVPLAPAFDVSV
jgi:hypothetical protein